MTGKSVFIVGPGFIGWNILDLLVAEGYQVSGLVRRKEHGAGIEKSGAQAIFGSLDDRELITQHTASSDIVFHTATADHLPSAEAILDGVCVRAAAGMSTIYIHTSGTGVLDDGALGTYAGDQIYSDSDVAAIDALPEAQPHRFVDLPIATAGRELGKKAKIAIMIPPEIYGWNETHGRLSIQIPTIARFALANGWAGHVGAGLSVESQIHVKDLARAYVVLLHALEKSDDTAWLYENPYFFCENGREFSWKEVAENVAESLVKAGRLPKVDVRPFERSHWEQLFGDETGNTLGLNSRSRAVRLREMGWAPREKSIWESWEQDELPALLQEWDARLEEKRKSTYVPVGA
ncbi:NAD(P)-binding protein [Exidia glandulosa HHB12029]|uniref:NAD(P)-binding protein n=1 Tax=Exidia glandulosa HHB12029 TaxID=1314781 RepID=A0A165K6I5_EXIGL|nr:NAD(P)-binding protein [Exidia glandulosa HHB12029]